MRTSRVGDFALKPRAFLYLKSESQITTQKAGFIHNIWPLYQDQTNTCQTFVIT